MNLDGYKEIWCVDFEFHQVDGGLPEPICMVAVEIRSQRVLRLWQDELHKRTTAPFSCGHANLYVAYFASAEIGCHLALGWPIPSRILDLYTEFRNMTSGLTTPFGRGLVGALAYHGLPAIGSDEKDEYRHLAIRGGPFTVEERDALLDYCQSDVEALIRLLPAMLPSIDVPRALLRGHYMAAVARMERVGTPDHEVFVRLQRHWGMLKRRLIVDVDREFGIYEDATFKRNRFAEYLQRNDLRWPKLISGQLALDDNTFKRMVTRYPQLQTLRDLRQMLSELKELKLQVGPDGRNRCLLSPFQTKTGRNAPSTTKFIFGLPAWLRGLIRPEPGRSMAYVDWGQQEFGIAAALSGDLAMQEAYLSGDPYLAFAKQAGTVPPGATRQSHARERSAFKIAALAVQYGMSEWSLAPQIGKSPAYARELLELHRNTYPRFWQWNDAAVDYAMLHGHLHTVFGWRVHAGQEPNVRSLANFLMQGNGAEMLRLACCTMTEAGISACAPVHDAVLIEADTECIVDVVTETQRHMLDASRVILDGFELRSDFEIVSYPDRYRDSRGVEMWGKVMQILDANAEPATADEVCGGRTVYAATVQVNSITAIHPE